MLEKIDKIQALLNLPNVDADQKTALANMKILNLLVDLRAEAKQLILSGVSKRYFLFGCINANKQKLKKLIIAPDRETAIADIETNYPYIEKWYSSEELNCY